MSEEPAGPITLAWETTFEDHVVVQRRVRGPLLIRQGATTTGLAMILWSGFAIGLLERVGICLLLGALVASIGILMLRLAFAPRRWTKHLRNSGLLALGPTSATLDGSGVWWRQEGSQSRFGWQAFDAVKRDRHGLWLTLRVGMVLRVPPRALAGWDDARVDAWRRDPAPPGEVPRPLDAVHVVDGELTTDTWAAAFAIVTRRMQRRGWPRVALSLGLYGALVFALSRTGADPTFARGLTSLVGVVLVLAWMWLGPRLAEWSRRRALAKRPASVPLGALEARLGPAGVWTRTPTGSSQFAWSWITQIDQGEEAIALVVGLGSVIALPRAAIAEPDRLVADCRSWMEGAPRLRGGVPTPGRGTARDVDNAFAPPD